MSHSQLAGMLYIISYSILTASLGTKGLLTEICDYSQRDCCFKILSILHDTNMLPITCLSISITRYCFLPSLSHRFTLSQSGLTRMLYYISYYIEAAPL